MITETMVVNVVENTLDDVKSSWVMVGCGIGGNKCETMTTLLAQKMSIIMMCIMG